jgi:hypothetical protein
VIPLADFLAGNGFVPTAQAASDFVPIVASGFGLCRTVAALLEVSANLGHCHLIFHCISLTHWKQYNTTTEKVNPKKSFFSFY